MKKTAVKAFLGTIIVLLTASGTLFAQIKSQWIENPAKMDLEQTLSDIQWPQSAHAALVRSFKLSAEMGNYRDNHYFSFTETGAFGRDNSDAIEMSPLDYINHMSFSTVVEGVQMSINNLPYDFDEIAEFPLALYAYEAGSTGYIYTSGNVTVNLSNLKNIPEDWKIIINDHRTGESVDLVAAESYTFAIMTQAVDEENPELTISVVPGNIKQITATAQDGNWDDADTWLSGVVPDDEESLEEVFIEHNVLLNKDVTVGKLEIKGGKTLSLNSDFTLTINNGELNADEGNFISTNGTVLFSGESKATGNLSFNRVELSGKTHIANTAVINGALVLNGGYLVGGDMETALNSSSELPDYGHNAELIYATSFEFENDEFGDAFGVSEGKIPAKVVVKDGATVKFGAPIRVMEGTLTIENGAEVNANGSLLLKYGSTLENEGTLSGDVGLQQKVDGTEGWRFLASPVSTKQNGENISYFDLLSGYSKIWTQGSARAETESGESNVFTYDFDADAGKYSYVPLASLKEDLEAGQGFIAYIFEAEEVELNPETGEYEKLSGEFPKYLTVFGELQEEAEILAPLHSEASTWSLVGNPYNVDISWEELSKTAKGLSKAVYIYDHQAGGNGYHVHNTEVGDPFGGIIAPFQAFLVINTQEDEERELKFTEAVKTEEKATFYKDAEEISYLKLQAVSENMEDELFVSFNATGSIGADEYDAIKLSPLYYEDYLTFSTKAEDRLLHINNLPKELTENLEIPLSLNHFEADETELKYIAKDAEITVQATELKNIPETWNIYLNNHLTGEKFDLREEENVTIQLSDKNKKIKSVDFNSVLVPLSVNPEITLDASDLSLLIEVKKDYVSNEIEDKPAVFALEQNYPNPFNPATTIKYSVPQNGEVHLVIYNVLGMKVAELVNETKAAGSYSIHWDAGQASSGIYFYKLTTAGKTATKRMTLIK